MKNPFDHLSTLLLTAWVGSLWAVGYLAVPVLFSAQPDRQLAGMLAGRMFAVSGYFGMLCAAWLLAHLLLTKGRSALRTAPFRIMAAMLLIALAIQFGIQPVMADLKLQALPLDVMHSGLAGRFRMLHGASSIAYLIESLLGAYLLIKTARN
ncbi:MAG: DUF4149 domain-containing protein [Nitrosomonadales bacterium]|nr:DUF4149 domain-containing protein [Nitrosomonadales bacterium]